MESGATDPLQPHDVVETAESRHRKELKALEGERRAAVKKLKATLGKKAKDAIATCEADYDAQVVALKVQHTQELASLLQLGGGGGGGSSTLQEAPCPDNPPSTTETEPTATTETDKTKTDEKTTTASSSNKKQDKARRKRQQQRAAELERQRQIEQELANAGPLPRHVELEQLQNILLVESSTSTLQQQQHYEIVEIPADGHCLYRAVAAQLNHIHNNNNTNLYDYQTVRALCADQLAKHPDEYAPFAEWHDDNDKHNTNSVDNPLASFTAYCERVRTGSDWGGHLELRALATALQRPIHIYSVAANGRVIVEPEHSNNPKDVLVQPPPIRLSYHVHYYALGEHYNQVIGR